MNRLNNESGIQQTEEYDITCDHEAGLLDLLLWFQPVVHQNFHLNRRLKVKRCDCYSLFSIVIIIISIKNDKKRKSHL